MTDKATATGATPKTLYWYFTIGRGNEDAYYLPQPELIKRLDREGIFSLSDRELEKTYVKAKSVTAGLLQLLGEPLEGWRIKLRMIDTPELSENQKRGQEHTGVPKDHLTRELPSWVELNNEHLITSRGYKQMEELIRWMLFEESTDLQPGDAVLFESTSGLRPVQMVFTLGAELIRTLKPDVKILGTTYAELGVLKELDASKYSPLRACDAGVNRELTLSPIYDLSELLRLPSWASAQRALRDRFDSTWLVESLEGLDVPDDAPDDAPDNAPGSSGRQGASHTKRALEESLTSLTRLFHLGLPDGLIAPLKQINADVRARELDALGPAWKIVSELLGRQVDELLSEAPNEGDPLSMNHIDFQLKLVEALLASERQGEALRVLRELMVTRMTLGLSGGRGITGGGDKKQRRGAERALFMSRGELKKLWDELTELRNQVSHANTGNDKEDIALLKSLDGAFKDQAGLHTRARALCHQDELWRGASSQGGQIVWLTAEGREASPVEPSVRLRLSRRLSAYAGESKLCQVQARDEHLDPQRLICAQLKIPESLIVIGKDWLNKTWRNASVLDGSRLSPLTQIQHIVLCGYFQPKLIAELVRQTEQNEVLCWALTETKEGHDLEPLFSAALKGHLYEADAPL